jgi:hypothetical protein
MTQTAIFITLLFLEGARDAIGMLRIISEWTLEIDEKLCACFVDWQKAFDCANWTKLMQTIKAILTNWHKKRLISKLYMDQSVKLKLDQEETRKVKTGRGVIQRCCLSPVLLNLYSEYPTKAALQLLKALKTSK